MGRHVTHDVCTEWSGQNAADDQRGDVFDMSHPSSTKNVVATATVMKNSAALTEPTTLRGA